MSTLVLVGDRFNLAKRGTVTCSPSADSAFPVTSLYDDIADEIMKFGSLGTDAYIQIDADLFAGYGAMEGTFTSGVPAGFVEASTGDGDLSEEAVVTHGGSKACKLTSGASGVAVLQKDITARAGGVLTSDVWVRGDGTATTYLRVQNLTTGKWLSSTGTWGSSVDAWASRSANSYNNLTLSFNTESYDDSRADTYTLRFQAVVDSSGAGGAGSGYVDDWKVYPSVSFVSIHGHNIPPNISVKVISAATSNFASPTTQATLTVGQPTFYGTFTAVGSPYWRVKFEGTPLVDKIYIGELVLGVPETLSVTPLEPGVSPWKIDETYWQTRVEMSSGREIVTGYSSKPRRVIRLPFHAVSPAEWLNVRSRIYERSNGGLLPMVIVPNSSESIVIHGRVPKNLSYQRTLGVTQHHQTDIEVRETPHPAVGL